LFSDSHTKALYNTGEYRCDLCYMMAMKRQMTKRKKKWETLLLGSLIVATIVHGCIFTAYSDWFLVYTVCIAGTLYILHALDCITVHVTPA